MGKTICLGLVTVLSFAFKITYHLSRPQKGVWHGDNFSGLVNKAYMTETNVNLCVLLSVGDFQIVFD